MGFVLYFNLLIILVFGLIWAGIITFLKFKKEKNLSYLIFFTIFYIYLYKVLDYTLFQFQSLVLIKYFMPNLILRGQTFEESMNLIPLIALTPQDLQTSLLNILLFIPYGFGLPFITDFRMKRVIITGAIFSIAIELQQLLTGLLAGITFRIADINDVIFNTLGVAAGYILFVGFVRISHSWKRSENPILKYIADRPQVNKR